MRRIIAGLVIVVGLATAGIAYAESQPADPSVGGNPKAAAPNTAGGKARPAGKAGVLKGAIHGDLLIRAADGSTRTVTFDRGKLTSLTDSRISLERPDGVAVSADVTSATVFTGTPREQLQPGMPVIVVSSDGKAERVLSKGALAQRCAANPDGAAPANGLRPRLKARLCQRLGKGQTPPDGAAGGQSPVVPEGLFTIES